MSDFPDGVCGAIRHALVFNLRDHHQRFGEEELSASDLYFEIVEALKWVHATNADTAVHLVSRALAEATDEGGPTLDAAAQCLRHSLTQSSGSYGKWTADEAERFLTAALILR
ncbi:hypothetical protein [Streptomyces cucumeris]|uniref:hypothetical protein n=1 Tax=Streptomyces cucumeris TaxID=2962890 RepID=UPI003EB9883D